MHKKIQPIYTPKKKKKKKHLRLHRDLQQGCEKYLAADNRDNSSSRGRWFAELEAHGALEKLRW